MARDADQFTVEEVFNKGKLRIPDSQRKFELLEARGQKNPRYVNAFLADLKSNPSPKWDINAINSRTLRIANLLYQEAFKVK